MTLVLALVIGVLLGTALGYVLAMFEAKPWLRPRSTRRHRLLGGPGKQV